MGLSLPLEQRKTTYYIHIELSYLVLATSHPDFSQTRHQFPDDGWLVISVHPDPNNPTPSSPIGIIGIDHINAIPTDKSENPFVIYQSSFRLDATLSGVGIPGGYQYSKLYVKKVCDEHNRDCLEVHHYEKANAI